MSIKSRGRRIAASEIPVVKRRLLDGDFQHEIAADYGVNQGRISEINTGKVGLGIPPAPPS